MSVSRQQLFQEIKGLLQNSEHNSDFENPVSEARYCLLAALNITPAEWLMRPDESVTPEDFARAHDWARRRAHGEPLAYLCGHREFWGREFEVNASTLIPRADSETLIEAVLTLYPKSSTPLEILDIGTGSGCLLITLLSECKAATGMGIDVSQDALHIALRNAQRHRVDSRAHFYISHWFSALQKSHKNSFDVIVSNPPYIPTMDIKTLSTDVRDYEPHLALDGGKDGLDAYRILIQQAPDFLKPKGLLIFEVGHAQAQEVAHMMKKANFETLPFFCDIAGIARIVAGFKQ
jgi:release factor glutamine methyltransferase